MQLLKEFAQEEQVSLELNTTFDEVASKFGDLSKLDPTLSARNIGFHLDTLTKGYFDKFNDTQSPFAFCGAKLHQLWWEQFTGEAGNANEVALSLGCDSLSDLIEQVKSVAESIQGNGWVVITTQKSIIPVSNHGWTDFGHVALIVDLWEHAYQTDYDSDKAKYIHNLLSKAVSWSVIANRLKG